MLDWNKTGIKPEHGMHWTNTCAIERHEIIVAQA
jgi:hypothetical protein